MEATFQPRFERRENPMMTSINGSLIQYCCLALVVAIGLLGCVADDGSTLVSNDRPGGGAEARSETVNGGSDQGAVAVTGRDFQQGMDAAQAETESDRLIRFLPDPALIGDWKPNGDPEIYTGDELYIYINGGAETYQKYGFRDVVAQQYTAPACEPITLEIYRMNDTAAAQGIYDFKRGDRSEPVEFGSEGQFEGYFLNFRSSNLVITIIGQNESESTKAGLMTLAAAMEKPLQSRNNLGSDQQK